MTSKELTQTIAALFNLAAYGEEEAIEALSYASEAAEIPDDPNASPPVSARTFWETGVMTSDDGFVLKFDDGTEFQITVVQSR